MTTELTELFYTQELNFQQNAAKLVKSLSKDKDFNDVTIVCAEGVKFHAHKVILSASSPFFKNVLLHIVNHHNHPVILLPRVMAEHFQNIVEYIYCGETNIHTSEIDNFMETARTLEITGFVRNILITGLVNALKPTELANPVTNETELELPVETQDVMDLFDERDNQHLDLNARIEDLVHNRGEPMTNELFAEIAMNSDETVANNAAAAMDIIIQQAEDIVEIQTTGRTLSQLEPMKLPSGGFKCAACVYVGRNKADVKKHHAAEHIGIPHMCTRCNISYKFRSSFVKHLKKCT